LIIHVPKSKQKIKRVAEAEAKARSAREGIAGGAALSALRQEVGFHDFITPKPQKP
jgi:hypothetical protein